MQSILVAAALGMELRYLARRLGKARYINSGDLKARQFFPKGREVLLFKTGIGRKQAAESIQNAINKFSPGEILFIGMAGSLRSEFRVGAPFMISTATQWPAETENLSIEQAVGLKLTYENTNQPLVKHVKGTMRVRRATLLTVDSYVNTLREKRRLGTAGFDLVDMEFGAVAAVVDMNKTPLTGLKTVSDSLSDNFPAFRMSAGEGSRGVPPPRLMFNSVRACRVLAGFAHLWIKSLMKLSL